MHLNTGNLDFFDAKENTLAIGRYPEVKLANAEKKLQVRLNY